MGEEHPVFVRVAADWIDLGDEHWRAIRIRNGRWKIAARPDVRFTRSAITAALPEPVDGGTIEELWRFFNVKKAGDRLLLLTWLLYCLQPDGPYPVMVVTGDQGSAKSTFLNLVRMLVDPRTESLPSLPRNAEDLFIRAAARHLLAFDNVSFIPDWLSDILCQIAMGGTLSKRELYTAAEETVLTACNPILLNGIAGFVTRPDLADRAVFLVLASIPKDRRRPEREFWASFEEARPRIFGALVDVLAKALQLLPDIDLDEYPRMADFACFGVAVERALGLEDGTFMDAYSRNQDGASMDMVEADSVATALLNMMAGRREWRGTYSDLLSDLHEELGTAPRPKDWPLNTKALQMRLDRVRPALLASGIDAPRPTRSGHERTRLLVIRQLAPVDDNDPQPIRAQAPVRGAVTPPRKVNGHRFPRLTQEQAAARRQRRENQGPDTSTSRAKKELH